jgi:hypothetical protein
LTIPFTAGFALPLKLLGLSKGLGPSTPDVGADSVYDPLTGIVSSVFDTVGFKTASVKDCAAPLNPHSA